jgi:hypothetical protein
MRGIFTLAINNILRKAGTYVKVLFGFSAVFFVAFCLIIYSGSLSSQYDVYLGGYEGENRIEAHGALSRENAEIILADDNVRGIVYYSYSLLDYATGIVLTIDGREWVISEPAPEDGLVTVAFDIDANTPFFYDTEMGGTFIQNYLANITNNNTEPLFLYGGDLQNDGGVLLNKADADLLGLTDLAGLIGKTLMLADGEFSFTAKIKGITNPNAPHGFLFDRSVCGDEYFALNPVLHVSLKDFVRAEKTIALMESLYGKDGGGDWDDGIWFVYWGRSVLDKMAFLQKQQGLCDRFFSLLSVITFAVVFLYIASNQYFLLKKNTGYYGILKAAGMSERKIFLLYLSELLAVGLISLLVSAGLAAAAFAGLAELLSRTAFVELSADITDWLAAFGWLTGATVLFSLLIAVVIYKTTLSKPPVSLLKGNT